VIRGRTAQIDQRLTRTHLQKGQPSRENAFARPFNRHGFTLDQATLVSPSCAASEASPSPVLSDFELR